MNRRVKQILIFSVSVVLVLSLYGLIMYGLKDFNSETRAMRIDETGDDNRTEHPFLVGNDTSFKEIGQAVGFILWEAKGVDIILVGVILLVASEAAASIVKGVEEQRKEIRTEMLDTDKFVILERKDAGESEEAE